MTIQAVAFDTGGTVLDWHGGLVAALRAEAGARQLQADWHAVVNDWRRRTLQGVLGLVSTDRTMDDVHRTTLDEALDAGGLQALDAGARHRIWRTWHALDTWPDFMPALARLRTLLPVVSFTMLPTSLVIDVARRNGFAWDAVVSCEMIGRYKPHPEAYLTAARWIGVAPHELLMVACHNFDLNAAHHAGLRTAFVRRPLEWGPPGPPDPLPNMAYDFVEDDFGGLERSVRAHLQAGAG